MLPMLHPTSLARALTLSLTMIFMLFYFASGHAHAGERPLKTGEIKPAAIYHNYCSVCHGDRGDGRSRATNSLVPPPRDFTSGIPMNRETMVTIVTHGKETTAMVGWKTQLNAVEIEAVVDYVRQTFMAAALDPSVQRGKILYAQNCLSCHGDRGQGSASQVPGPVQPRDLASPKSREELSRERILASVTHGRPGTAMAGFAGKLPAADIEAVVDYVSAVVMMPVVESISGTRAHGGRSAEGLPTLSPQAPPANKVDMRLPLPKGLIGSVSKGGQFFNTNCATCHGAKGDGNGPRGNLISPRPRNFIEGEARLALNRPAIFEAVVAGKPGTEMLAWGRVLTDQEVANVSEYVFRQFISPGSK